MPPKKRKQKPEEELALSVASDPKFTAQVAEVAKAAEPAEGVMDTICRTLKTAVETVREEDLVNITQEEYEEEIRSLKGSEHVQPELFDANLGFDPTTKFAIPSRFVIVGSYLTKCACKPKLNVDLCLVMPETVLASADYSNFRYFKRRLMYLSRIAKLLKATSGLTFDFSDMTIDFPIAGDTRKPCLIIRPRGSSVPAAASAYTIRISASYELKGEPAKWPAKLQLNKASIRPINYQAGKEDGPPPLPSPGYNQTILEDSLQLYHLQELAAVTTQGPNLTSAIRLLKVWARNRRLSGFNSFILSQMAVYLTKKGLWFPSMTPGIACRVFFDHFLNTDLTKTRISVQNAEGLEAPHEVLEHFAAFFPIVFLDSTHGLNLTHRVSVSEVIHFRHECQMAFEHFTSPYSTVDPASACKPLFLSPQPVASKFDYVFSIRRHAAMTTLSDIKEDRTYAHMDPVWAGESDHLQMQRRVLRLIFTAMKERIMCVVPIINANEDKSIAVADKDVLVFGVLNSNSQNALSMVDFGPSGEELELVEEFRHLWGDKAELRRFKDASIRVAAVWECETWERYHILPRIIEHLIRRHFDIDASLVAVHSEPLLASLHLNGKDPAQLAYSSTAATETLKKILTESSLPLEVHHVSAIHPTVRGTAVLPIPFNPLASPAAFPIMDPIHIIIQFQKSSKWPSNLEAINSLKSALYIAIATSLRTSHGDQYVCRSHYDYVDVIGQGHAFRIFVFHPTELAIIKNLDSTEDEEERKRLVSVSAITSHVNELAAGDPRKNKGKDKKKAASASLLSRSSVLDVLSPLAQALARPSIANRRLLYSTLHDSFIAGVASQHSAYPLTCRLAKRWVFAQGCGTSFVDRESTMAIRTLELSCNSRKLIFSELLNEEAIELLVAYIFDSGLKSMRAPRTPLVGFHRFLRLITDFDFETQPIIVDGSNSITKTEIYEAKNAFHKLLDKRARHHAGMYILCKYDEWNSSWTEFGPSTHILQRLKQRASISLNFWSQLSGASCLDSQAKRDWNAVIRPSNADFDIVLHLKPWASPRFQSLVSLSEEPAEKLALVSEAKGALAAEGLDVSDVEFPPVGIDIYGTLVAAIRDRLGASAIVCADSVFGDVIQIVWKPTVFKKGIVAAGDTGAFGVLSEDDVEMSLASDKSPAFNLEEAVLEVQKLAGPMLESFETPKAAAAASSSFK